MEGMPQRTLAEMMTISRRWALNRADLVVILLVLFAVTLAAIVLIYEIPPPSQPGADGARTYMTAVVGAWGAVSLAIVGAAVRLTWVRIGLITLLSSEIKAIQYGLLLMDMLDFWVGVYRNPERGAEGFADTPREEKYFEIFHSVSENVGNLHPAAVESIVRFYTYLKMSRDAAGSLKSWDTQQDPDKRKAHIRYVVDLLTQSMLWGFAALWHLGFQATDQNRSLLEKLHMAYEAIHGQKSFNEKLLIGHAKRRELELFFAVRVESNLAPGQQALETADVAPNPASEVHNGQVQRPES
jgi:hypothetical protein